MNDLVTTTLTNTHSVVLVQLSSGNVAMVSYTLTAGDVLVATLLAALLALHVVEIWRGRRIG
jgi:hypothetical protein